MDRTRGRLGWWFPVVALAAWSCGKSQTETPAPAQKESTPEVSPAPIERSDETGEPAPFEMVGDVGLLPVPVSGFESLPLRVKQNLYYEYTAAEGADAVHLARLGPVAERAQRILLGIIEAGPSVPGNLREKIVPYAARFQLHRGPFDAWTGERMRPSFIPGELAAAVQKSIQSGIDLGQDQFEAADLGANQIEQLEAFLSSVRPFIFERDSVPRAYEDNEREADSKPPEAIPGDAARCEIAEKIRAQMKRSKKNGGGPLADLATFLESGDATRFQSYIRLWIKQDGEVDSLMGFLLPCCSTGCPGEDAASFGAFVAVRDDDRSVMMRKVASEAPYFELRLPGNAMFRRPRKQVGIPNAGAYHLVSAFGAMAPRSRMSFSLPLPMWGRGLSGRRTVVFTNLADATKQLLDEKWIKAFSATDEIAFRREKWRDAGLTAFLALKHIIGYQAGTRPGGRSAVGGAPFGKRLSRPEEILEELHADLVALYFIADPKAVEMGLVPETECAHAVYDEYVGQLIEQSVPADRPDHLVEPAVLARRIAVRFAVEKGAVLVDAEEGRFFAVVSSPEAMRRAVEELLAEVQRMVSVGDLGGFDELMKKYGGPPPSAWAKEVALRLNALGLPQKLGFAFPRLTPKRNAKGEISDVILQYPSAPTGRLEAREARR